ncbi:hypothetical protein ACLB2K_029148 [Fragaria x ananassa]
MISKSFSSLGPKMPTGLKHQLQWENWGIAKIPSCIGNLVVALRSLPLGSNLLNSTIPSTLWGLAHPASKLVIQLSHWKSTTGYIIGGLQDLVNLSLANNALSGSIPDSKEKFLQNSSLNILQRLNIIIDVASALEYHHHGYEIPIVHCDVKSGNNLLDEDMVAHVADFGIAKLLGGGVSTTQTMTLATVGYMAPVCGIEGIVSRRGDVYSFGIVVMKTLTRRKPTDTMFVGDTSLKQWVAN